MGERFKRYSKYIIQDRAIPDVRDGLKPVQRRILYAMYRTKNTYDHDYLKSAATVGEVIGKYHPHGDTSIYDAMVRMSQNWKARLPLIDMQGNNGSIDGDSPAAYRYTEARLAKISNELLRDIDRNTVIFAPNFDDKHQEPTVLPSRFPNLLVNGASGISAGYATNIPPHNLGEIIDATIFRIDNPNSRLETIMNIVKGPDFPTGGIIEGIDGIKNAYTTGRGRIIIKSKTFFEETKGRKALIVSETPYEGNKSFIVRTIDDIKIDKKIDGLVEVRDESDKEGLRIAIDLKKEANEELILNYLLKNTDLQISYNFNMIAIVNRRPKLLGLLEILDSYVTHQKEVITRRCQFDLENYKIKFHIAEGLVKCISILDEVIRASKNKADSIVNLAKTFGFSEKQAEAIVILQLYRLSNTDIKLLEEELNNYRDNINRLTLILSDETVFRSLMKDELRQIKKDYSLPRITEIKEEITEIKIDTINMIPKEDVIVLVTKDGYVKRTSYRSYMANKDEPLLKDNDYVLGLFELNTVDTVLLFTNLGNYLYVPVHIIPDIKWKELGKHISNLIKLEDSEEIISALPVTDFEQNKSSLIGTKNGMIKRTKISDFKISRYNKTVSCFKLKENDSVVTALTATYSNIFIGTANGYGLWFDLNDVPVVGLKTSGVKAINLKNDYVVNISNFDSSEYLTVVTDKNTAKRVKLSEFDKSNRARRGLVLVREVKTNPYKILKIFITDSKAVIGLKSINNLDYLKVTEIPIADRYSTGSSITKTNLIDVFVVNNLIIKDNLSLEHSTDQDDPKQSKLKPSLKEIDERLFDIDKYLNN